MASKEHLDILKQGVDVWNEWRKENPEVQIDFSGTNLRNRKLRKIDFHSIKLRETDLAHIDLFDANLIGIDVYGAFLAEAQLSGANLTDANLDAADFGWATLNKSNLSGASLAYTNFIGAELVDTNLRKANLFYTRFCQVIFNGADLGQARMNRTVFEDVDLSVVKGLETVEHKGPSTIGIDTIVHSQGKIPEIFLRKAGVPDSIIEAIPSLIGSLKPIDYYTCFISYSSKDQEFVERLYADLQNKGVRCWFAPEDLKIGDKIRDRIDQSIRLYDKLLLILSEESVMSEWVEDEVEAAMEKERLTRERGEERTVLFPVRLDEAVKTTTKAWAAKLRRQRHIGNFSSWKNHDNYHQAFDRLLRDLEAAP
jgi:uncharacterized protein YjbI with pentapeptide repeats